MRANEFIVEKGFVQGMKNAAADFSRGLGTMSRKSHKAATKDRDNEKVAKKFAPMIAHNWSLAIEKITKGQDNPMDFLKLKHKELKPALLDVIDRALGANSIESLIADVKGIEPQMFLVLEKIVSLTLSSSSVKNISKNKNIIKIFYSITKLIRSHHPDEPESFLAVVNIEELAKNHNLENISGTYLEGTDGIYISFEIIDDSGNQQLIFKGEFDKKDKDGEKIDVDKEFTLMRKPKEGLIKTMAQNENSRNITISVEATGEDTAIIKELET